MQQSKELPETQETQETQALEVAECSELSPTRTKRKSTVLKHFLVAFIGFSLLSARFVFGAKTGRWRKL